MTVSQPDQDTDLLETAAGLASAAKRGTGERGLNDNTAGNIRAHREALIEELEALRLTLIALLLPLGQSLALEISHLESDVRSLRADLDGLPAKLEREQRRGRV